MTEAPDGQFTLQIRNRGGKIKDIVLKRPSTCTGDAIVYHKSGFLSKAFSEAIEAFESKGMIEEAHNSQTCMLKFFYHDLCNASATSFKFKLFDAVFKGSPLMYDLVYSGEGG